MIQAIFHTQVRCGALRIVYSIDHALQVDLPRGSVGVDTANGEKENAKAA